MTEKEEKKTEEEREVKFLFGKQEENKRSNGRSQGKRERKVNRKIRRRE